MKLPTTDPHFLLLDFAQWILAKTGLKGITNTHGVHVWDPPGLIEEYAEKWEGILPDPQPSPLTEEPWDCKCGYMNTGPVCTHCYTGRTAGELPRSLTALERELLAALRNLKNEAYGFLSMADIKRHGYTNYAVLKTRLDEAAALLDDPRFKNSDSKENHSQ